MKSITNFASMYSYNSGELDRVVEYVYKPKLHGTNVSILMDKDGKFECRSKNRVLSINNDHMEFCQMMEKHRESLLEELKHKDQQTITLFGEWAGPGVQRSDAVSKMDKKRLFIFSMESNGMFYGDKILYNQYGDDIYELPILDRRKINFYHRADVQAEVDLINKIVDTYEVEDPYIKGMFKLEGSGEGIVGAPIFMEDRNEWFSHAFKAKTEAHRVKKTNLPAAVREPLPQEAFEFAETYATLPRLKQCITELSIETPSMKDTANVLQWMHTDIVKESVEDLKQMNVGYKTISKAINPRIVEMWKNVVQGKVN